MFKRSVLVMALLLATTGFVLDASAFQTAGVVDEVIRMKKAGIGDDLIIAKLRQDAKPMKLSIDDMIKLKEAGVADAITQTIINPGGGANVAPAAAAPQPAPAAAAAPAAASSPAPRGANKSVSIAPFTFSAPMDEFQAAFGSRENIGTGVKAIMTQKIAQGGKLTVVESDVSFLKQELAISNSSSGKQGTGGRLGQMRGADLVLMGDIIIFGRDDQQKSGAAGGITRGLAGVFGGGAKSNKAVVVISYRLIDSETREVVLSAEARGESKREDKNMFGALLTRAGGGGARVDMTSSNFANTILGEATIDSVVKLTEVMTEKIATLPAKFVEIEGRVSAAEGTSVTLNVGSNDGVQVGDVFEISRIVKEFKDPTTGEVLDLQLEAVGTLTIGEVRPRIATGNFVGGTVASNYVARKKRP